MSRDANHEGSWHDAILADPNQGRHDMAEGFNVATVFVDRNVAEGRAAKTAIECGDESISYKTLAEKTNRLGNILRRLGVRREERVVLLLLDCPEFLYSFFGTIKIGAVAVPVNTLLRPAEWEYILNDTRARVAVVSQELAPQFDAVSDGGLRYLETVVRVGRNQKPHANFQDLMNTASDELEPELMTTDDAAFWLYSSGSTGTPKGCVHLHHDMPVATEHYAKEILRMDGRDRCYSVPRLFFAYGLGNAGYFPLHFGATTILNPARPTPASIFADIERYRPTLFFSVPSNYAALAAHEPSRKFDLSSIRHAISAGECLPAPVFHRFKERFGIEILDAWGSTETLHMAISNRPGEVRPGSSGKVLPGYEAKIVDLEGKLVPCGEIGNLMVRTDSTCSMYWNQHERTKQAFDGPWFRTGDKYHQDEDGYFWYAGRADDLFKVGGKWVSPMEVESALLAHESVAEAAVIAREDEDRLPNVAAYVVLNPGVRPDERMTEELQQWVAKRIGGYKKPRWIEYVPELPRTATGKLQRFKLREAASASSRELAARRP